MRTDKRPFSLIESRWSRRGRDRWLHGNQDKVEWFSFADFTEFLEKVQIAGIFIEYSENVPIEDNRIFIVDYSRIQLLKSVTLS